MIAIDSSAIVAILLREAEASLFLAAIASGPAAVASPTLVETHIVLANRGVPEATLRLQEFVAATATTVFAFEAAMAAFAHAAFLQFGKGRHPAGLNFGDCMAYALAKSLDAPLLYKGNDFAQTDIRSALA